MSNDDQRPARRRRARRAAGPAGDAVTESAGVFVVDAPNTTAVTASTDPPTSSAPEPETSAPEPETSTPETETSTPKTGKKTSARPGPAKQSSGKRSPGKQSSGKQRAGKQTPPARTSRRSSRRVVGWVAAVAAVMIVVAGAVMSGLFAVRTDDIRSHEARCAQYSGFARQMIVNLTSLSPDNIDQAIATFQRSTSGRALADVQQTMENTAGLIKEDKVTTRGTVLSDAVSACDSDSGSVLVVSGWQLRNPSAKQDVVQTFRWRVDVTDINGALKATKIQWVT